MYARVAFVVKDRKAYLTRARGPLKKTSEDRGNLLIPLWLRSLFNCVLPMEDEVDANDGA